MRDESRPGILVGTVGTIFRFPIKSVGGRSVEQAYVGEKGVVGDRRYAFVDLETGNLCNAKNPRKYGSMLACKAYYLEEPVPGEPLPTLEVLFPDGGTHRSVGTDLDDAMSDYLGRRVRLTNRVPEGSKTEIVWDEATGLPKEGAYAHTTKNADGDEVLTYAPAEGDTFFDLTPLHVMTTSTVRHLQRLEPASNFDPRRYRPTMVLDTSEPGLVEDGWVGGHLMVGDELTATIDLWTPRCVMSTLAHDGDVPLDRSTLRAIARHNSKVLPGWGRMACAGVYAGVAATGLVRTGDPVRFRAGTAQPPAPPSIPTAEKRGGRPRSGG